jgi:diacylglycerol kinase family enzyme
VGHFRGAPPRPAPKPSVEHHSSPPQIHHHLKPIALQLDGELLALDPGTPVRTDIAPAALVTMG